MLFNSGTFLQFFAAFLLLYYVVRNRLEARNFLIVAASYFFYGWWDYRFLSLLVLSSLIDFAVGVALDRTQSRRGRKWLVALSITASLGILGFFKYYGFFVESFAALASSLGIRVRMRTLEIVLPVGISFYTFQTMSYVIDVYRGEIKATRNLVHFLAYVSFFPQLVAGPIERAKHLLPQFAETRRITRFMLEEGLWLCLWGMFKKVVVADSLAPLVEMVYGPPQPGALLVALATFAFALQIYCDFSGYSDLARGTALLLGFDIMFNFNLPYVAANIRDFWRRWHISFSTWLRDYLYISLGGNRRGAARTYLNLFTTMALGGLWHGAAWNFVAWGVWHGLGLMAHRFWTLRSSGQSSEGPAEPSVASGRAQAGIGRVDSRVRARSSSSGRVRRSTASHLASGIVTMAFVSYGWLLFRAGSWENVVTLTRSLGHLTIPAWAGNYVLTLVLVALPLIGLELWQYRANDLLVVLRRPRWLQALLQGALLIGIVVFWEKAKVPFIYFQF
jgi:D-alanyl-lipoteichoic acid acyltransferase DltB (MBOAT superfamily)